MAEVDWIPGRATPQGTRRFAARFPDLPGHFRCPDRLSVSSFGLGTRAGEIGGVDDLLYRQAVPELLAGGVNLFDTALSDRMQTSERALGVALTRALREGVAARDEIVVVTKGGLLTPDPELARSSAEARRNLIATYRRDGARPAGAPGRRRALPRAGVPARPDPAQPTQPAAGDARRLVPRAARARAAGIRRPGVPARDVSRLRGARAGGLRWTDRSLWSCAPGMASCARTPTRGHLSLLDLFQWALDVGGADHHLRAHPTAVQPGDGRGAAPALAARPRRRHRSRALGAARHRQPRARERTAGAGARVRAPAGLRARVPAGAAQRRTAVPAVRRSSPGITAAIVGMRDAAHIDQNLALARVPVASPEAIEALFKRAGAGR